MADRTRSASIAAVFFFASVSLAISPHACGQMSSLADGDSSGAFTPGPQTPAPPFPAGLVSGPHAKPELPPVPMPQDRSADSYRIYSVLLPVGELGEPGWPRDLWLLSDTTIAVVPLDQPCFSQDVDGVNMNPHAAIEVPPDHQQDFQEMLEDFDTRCHERVQLTPESFNLVVPLKLLTQPEQDEFIRTRFDPGGGPQADLLTAKYKGAPGLSRFSEVYFNAHHTLAMVYGSGWCGGLCSQSYWSVLELRDGAWHRLPWRTAILAN